MLRSSSALCLVLVCGLAGCGGPRPRDRAGDRRWRPGADDGGAGASVPEPPPRPMADAAPKGERPRLLVKASARALALDDAHLYYGDSEDDGVYAIAKTGGEPLRIARHAPVAGALALEGGLIAWIASPGDAVLRAPVAGGAQPTTLRDHGIFSDIASFGDDLFLAEAIAAGGALFRVTGTTTTKLAAFDGPPRAVLADATHAFVVTPTKVFRTSHARGELETVATGTRFNQAELDGTDVFLVAEVDQVRAILRAPKAGGTAAVVARDVRDAPIKIQGGEVLFFDGSRPQLRSVKTTGGESRVLVEDEGLTTVSAIEADAQTIYVAQGIHESGMIVAVKRSPSP